jgi:hypothetical protein
LDKGRLESHLGRAGRALNDEDYETIKAVVESYAYIAELVGEKNILSIRMGSSAASPTTRNAADSGGVRCDRPTLPFFHHSRGNGGNSARKAG